MKSFSAEQSQRNITVSAYVLHSKNYQESSQILQLFSYQYGRISIIAKGIKNKRSQARKALLQPFRPLLLELTGKSDLKTLLHVERARLSQDNSNYLEQNLQGQYLASAYYANEVLMRACPERQELSYLYEAYQDLINKLYACQQSDTTLLAPFLRNFEVVVLSEMGIAPDWYFDIDDNEVEVDQCYSLLPEHGFKKLDDTVNAQDVYLGQAILSLATGEHLEQNLKASQQITRQLLKEVIGDKPLQSRKLWQHLKSNT